MDPEESFITHLMGFGLTEKEARLYFYLLKYGPKTPSPLAKSLHTYREDVHRTLTVLIEKGMVRPSLDAPTVYTAVELESALESALKKHESELKEMERRKRELEELSRQQHFRPSDEVATFKVLKSLKEIASVAIPTLLSAEKEFLWIAPKQGLAFSSMFGITEVVEKLTERGGQTRGVTDIEYPAIPLVQELLGAGEDVRHFDNYRGLYYGVFDRRHCISAINIDIKHLRLDESAIMLYTDDPVYADYLVSTFEMIWQQSVPAHERMQELLKQGPPQP